ncbi:MAG TPA: hypothetical protein VG034_21105 [Acidimicrobiia bacterium]|jgi:uncharacterized membrane protein|nr:hypothetical protein [Acidimicrobiia bacterium]
MYKVLLFLHVLAVIVGLGPTFALPGLMKLRGDAPSPAVLRVEYIISRYASIGLGVILLTGLGLISESPAVFIGGFSEARWLHISITLFLIYAGLGTGYTAPRMRKAVTAAEAGKAAEVRRLLDPLDKIVGPILGLLLAAILYLMLIKPSF